MPNPLHWEYIRTLVHPGLRDSPEEYDKRVREGMKLAEQVAERVLRVTPVPTVHGIQAVHLATFAAVYPFAGQFKVTPNYIQTMTWGTAPPWRVESELLRIRRDATQWMKHAVSPEAKAQAMTAFCAQVWRIQPFLDGNTRVVHVFGKAYARQALGLPTPIFRETERKVGLVEANADDHDLTMLSRSLLGVRLPFERRQIDYSRECDQYPGLVFRRLSNGVSVAIEARSQEQARRILAAEVTKEYMQEVARRGGVKGIPVDRNALFQADAPRLTVDHQALEKDRKLAKNLNHDV